MTPSQVFGALVRTVRQHRGLTQQQLVDRLAELGLKMDRSTLNKLERGHRAATAPLDKVFTIAAALEVPVDRLISPSLASMEDQPVTVTPALTVPAWLVREWLAGRMALPAKGESVSARLADMDEGALTALVLRERTRGLNPEAAVVSADYIRAEVQEIVDEIRNPKEEPDG